MSFEIVPLLVLGFGLGLMHALDADHVMAVSNLSNQRPGLARTLRFSAHWALGHGAVLLLSGALLFSLGWALPQALQRAAEVSVGVLLIALGLLCFWQFRQEKIRLVEHRHGDLVHTHLALGQDNEHANNGQHTPVLVGVLHGLAGSAPALALVPAVGQGQLSVALVYLLIFSVGVMLSMLLFGLGFGFMQKTLQQRYQQLFCYSRRLIAATSIAIGSYWLVQAL